MNVGTPIVHCRTCGFTQCVLCAVGYKHRAEDPEDDDYWGTVLSDWVTPDGGTMEDADFEARVRDGRLTIEWDTTVPTPPEQNGGAGQVSVAGRVDAVR